MKPTSLPLGAGATTEQSIPTEIEVLRWAACPLDVAVSAPAVDDLNVERLLFLVRQHRMTHRLLYRLELGQPAWCPARLLTQLRLSRLKIEQRLRAQLAAAQEIAALTERVTKNPALFIKGFNVHALTGERRHIHWGGDIDVLTCDPEALYTALEKIGYTGESNAKSDKHGFATLQRESIWVEVHRYFPVNVYPHIVADLDPSVTVRSGARTQLCTNFTVRKSVTKTCSNTVNRVVQCERGT